MGVVTPYRWPDSVQNGPRPASGCSTASPTACAPGSTRSRASVHDRRWLKVVEDLYVWHWQNERYLRNEEPVARVGLVYSQQTARGYGGPQARQKVEDFSLGMYHALIEARMPVRNGARRHARRSAPIGSSSCCCPTSPRFRTRSAGRFATSCDRGGSVLATYETSLYDESGKRRQDFGLADLFGVSWRKTLDGPIPNSYLRVEETRPRPSGDAGLRGRAAADQRHLPAGRAAHRAVRRPAADRDPAVPQPADGEESSGVSRRPISSGVYLREFGKGRVVYFPWDHRSRLLGSDGGRPWPPAAECD